MAPYINAAPPLQESGSYRQTQSSQRVNRRASQLAYAIRVPKDTLFFAVILFLVDTA